MSEFKLAWINPTPRVTKATQIEAALAWGVDPDRGLWEHGKHDINQLINSLRKGDLVGVYTADLFAPPPRKRLGENRKDVFRRVAKALLEKGVRVHELKTGRTCGDQVSLIEMMLDARDAIAGNSGREAKGRPPKRAWKPEDYDTISEIWRDPLYKVNRQRVLAVQNNGFPEFTLNDFYRMKHKLGLEEKDD